MKLTYLLVIEGHLGAGYSAFLPDFPGIYLSAGTVRQLKLLIKGAVRDELDCLKEEGKPVPKPQEAQRFSA